MQFILLGVFLLVWQQGPHCPQLHGSQQCHVPHSSMVLTMHFLSPACQLKDWSNKSYLFFFYQEWSRKKEWWIMGHPGP